MKILVTGAAGFIGHRLSECLLEDGNDVFGVDNINDYYDVNLKYARLEDLGIHREQVSEQTVADSDRFARFHFLKLDIVAYDKLNELCAREKFDVVCNLAAQAGVRYSIQNPFTYAQSNVMGFLNILECCRQNRIGRLVFASSSSIYGMNKKVPFSEEDRTDYPESIYAATKKSDELMAYTYSRLYGLETTGLRLFTVYGPWGRPDMAPFLFLRSILEEREIRVFNNGNMLRDFTYIDDIVDGWMRVIKNGRSKEENLYEIYNVGHSAPVKLMDFIREIELCAGKEAKKRFEGMQPGDVYCTYADTTKLEQDYGYRPSTSLDAGIRKFYDWYVDYTTCQTLSDESR